MLLRPEVPPDIGPLHALIVDAFRNAPHASGTEADILDALRADGALSLSLVAIEADRIIGQVAFSPITIGGSLIQAGLDALRTRNAGGCVVLGDPPTMPASASPSVQASSSRECRPGISRHQPFRAGSLRARSKITPPAASPDVPLPPKTFARPS